MNVRRAVPDDAAAIARIHVDTWRDTYAGILPDRVLLNMSTTREGGGWSGSVLRGESVFVVQGSDDGIVGFGSCGPNRLRKLPCDGEVYTLYVAPGNQGHGFGKALMTRMLGELAESGQRKALVWVLRENPARFFYQAMGGRHLAEQNERLWETFIPQIAYYWTLPYAAGE
ncbi:MAG: GNAT family N-acetyltransferase [Alphaproteobacteria bacterium]|nr:GNAT family N-acetyltransferase [Alphaproteobacteria bacterium]